MDMTVIMSVLEEYLFTYLSSTFGNLNSIVLMDGSNRRKLQMTVAMSFSGTAVFEGPAPDSIEFLAAQREALKDTAALQMVIEANPNTGSEVVVGSVDIGDDTVPTPSPTDNGDDTNMGVIIGAVIAGLVVVALTGGFLWYSRRKRKNKLDESNETFGSSDTYENKPYVKKSTDHTLKETDEEMAQELKEEKALEPPAYDKEEFRFPGALEEDTHELHFSRRGSKGLAQSQGPRGVSMGLDSLKT